MAIHDLSYYVNAIGRGDYDSPAQVRASKQLARYVGIEKGDAVASPERYIATRTPKRRKAGRGLHFTVCLKCHRLFLEPITAKSGREYRHNRGNPFYGLCVACERDKGTSRVRHNSSLPVVNIPAPDPAPTDYKLLTGEWRDWADIAYRYSKRVPFDDRPDLMHDIIIELHKARLRDGVKLPALRAYRIASLRVALYWRKEGKRQVKVCLSSGWPKTPNYALCVFSHRPAKCAECCYHAVRPWQSLETEVEQADGNTTELMQTVADDNAIDLNAWMDARTWLLSAPYRLIEIANKKRRKRPLSHADRLYLSKWRKRAQKSLL